MPVSRAKSCDHCRRAKARCSLSTPCSRCAKRCLECHYTPSQLHRPEHERPTRSFRPIRPAAADPVHLNGTASGYHQLHRAETASGSIISLPEVTATGTVYSNTDAFLAQSTMMITLTSAETSNYSAVYPTLMPQLFDIPGLYDLPIQVGPEFLSLQTPVSIPTSLSFDDFLSSPRSMNHSLAGTTPRPKTSSKLPTPSRTVSVSSTKKQQQFSERTRSLQQGSLTAKMLYSRLTEYTRMMADAKHLPPFIHSPCVLGSNVECPADQPHQCLPETLSICANLTQMFYSRRLGSHSFIWQQIYEHIRQMRGEYDCYDKERKLEALQAALVYGMLCSQCTESVSSDDSAWVVATIETFARGLFSMRTWALDVDHVFFSRSEWVFVESLRRIGCLLYLLDLLLEIDTRTPSRGNCRELFDLPLACIRDLWQPISDREWHKLYQQHVNSQKQKSRRGLTLGHLLVLRQFREKDPSQSGGSQRHFEEELAEWCEGVDDLSMLLWMALTVEGDGQSQVVDIREKYMGKA